MHLIIVCTHFYSSKCTKPGRECTLLVSTSTGMNFAKLAYARPAMGISSVVVKTSVLPLSFFSALAVAYSRVGRVRCSASLAELCGAQRASPWCVAGSLRPHWFASCRISRAKRAGRSLGSTLRRERCIVPKSQPATAARSPQVVWACLKLGKSNFAYERPSSHHAGIHSDALIQSIAIAVYLAEYTCVMFGRVSHKTCRRSPGLRRLPSAHHGARGACRLLQPAGLHQDRG